MSLASSPCKKTLRICTLMFGRARKADDAAVRIYPLDARRYLDRQRELGKGPQQIEGSDE